MTVPILALLQSRATVRLLQGPASGRCGGTGRSGRWPDPASRRRYGTVLDANHDGYPDIFYGAESLRPDGLPSINRLYLNTGQGSFIDSPAMGLDLNIGSLCAHTVDYNSDGRPDLLVCGEAGACTCSETTKATASPMCPRSSAPR